MRRYFKFKNEIYCCSKNEKLDLNLPEGPTWQDSPVHKRKVLLEPGVAEVIDTEVPLDEKHVLEQRSGRVAAVGHPFVEGAVCDLPQQDHRFLHDC